MQLSHSAYNQVVINMAQNFAILCLVACCLSANLVEAELANAKFIKEQLALWELYLHPDQPDFFPKHLETGKDYSFKDNFGNYKNEEAIKEFVDLYTEGKMLPRGKLFSIFWPNHLEQAKAFFKVLWYAKDFETFYKTATWGRIYLNEGLFIYILTVAITHRPDTRIYKTPPHYEVFPTLYFRDEIIRRAYDAKAGSIISFETPGHPIIVPGNYSQTFYEPDDELSYFTEEPAVNSIHYMGHITRPFWLNTSEFEGAPKPWGGRYFYNYRTQDVRYTLERMSNKLGPVKAFNWNYRIPYGHFPLYSHANGVRFPYREEHAEFQNHHYKWLQKLQFWDQMIRMAIQTKHYIALNGSSIPFDSEHGLSTLSNMVEGNKNSVNPELYGHIDQVARTLLGFAPEPCGDHATSSTLQNFGKDMNDPMYWSYIKYILSFYDDAVSTWEKPSVEHYAYEDFEITSMSMDKVTTYFKDHEYLITNAVKAHGSNDTTQIKVLQKRLAHKPFSYRMEINSKTKEKAEIRMFLGTEFDWNNEEVKPSDFYKYMYPVHMFTVDLVPGINKIEGSNIAPFTSLPDDVTGDEFYAKLQRAEAGTETYEIPEMNYSYPEDMVVPMGMLTGLPMRLIAYVAPYNETNLYHLDSSLFGHKEFENKKPAYPFNAPLPHNFTELSNVYSYSFKNFLVDESEINATV